MTRFASFERLLRAASMVAGSSSYIIIASFARGVMLARLLSAQEYGLAIVLITISAGLDLLIDGGVDQYLVRSRFGARPDVVAVAQGYRFGASAIGGGLLALCASPLAHWLGAPQLAPAIALLAIPTVLRGLSNLEIKVQQRTRQYGQEAKVDIARYTAELIVLAIAAFVLRSYWAVVIGFMAHTLAQLLASRAICGRFARISFNARLVRLLSRFSVPVIANSAILFAAMQGDRLIIASAVDAASVARYATACAIGQAVMTLLARVTSRLFLPIFGAASLGQPHRRRQANQLTLAFIAGSAVIAAGLALVVPHLVPLIYGPAFGGLHRIVFASACLQMLQIEQSWLTTLMTGAGATGKFPLITGLRALGLPLALPLLWRTGDILLAPFALTIGAVLSLALSYKVLASLGILSYRTALTGVGRGVATVLGMLMILF